MNSPTERAAVRSDTGRALAFSDAVFAIIITVLVLDLRPPDVEPGRLLHGLVRQWPTYLAYVTSYLYVAVVWLNHKAAFTHVRAMDRRLHWANLGILFTTALLPFPTAVISDTMHKGNLADEVTAVGVYALIGAALCASWLALFAYLGRHSELLHDEHDQQFFARESARAWFGVISYLFAGALGYLLSPWVGLVIFLLLPIFYGITSHGLDYLPLPIRRSRT